MVDPTDQVVLAASEDVEKESRRLEAVAEDLSEAVDRLRAALDELRRGSARGRPFVWGVVSKWSIEPEGRSLLFTLDGGKLVLKRCKVAFTLQALLEPGGVRAADGQLYRAESWISARVAELSGQPPQSVGAVRTTLARVKTALKPLRDDWDRLIVRDNEVRGYRLAKAA